MNAKRSFSKLNNQQGVVAVIVAVLLVMLLGFIALSIDTSHLAVARNELQNAADAGALAGAAELYTDDGQAINTNANQIGFDASIANISEQVPVEVNWTGGNSGDVQRGHWSFGLGSLPRGFTPNDSTATVALWGVTTVELDENPNFINAVRVRSRRQNTPIASWFARIFGHDSFEGFAEAVAYIGFAGTLKTATAQAPIAICLQSIEQPDGSWDCNEGRFVNDAAGGQDEETAMWTSMDQGYEDNVLVDDVCSGGTNASDVKPLVECNAIKGGTGVQHPMLHMDKNMAVNNGQIDAVFNAFYNCWEDYKDGFMELTLPVIDCVDDPTTCAPLVGAVTVNVVWMTQQPNYKDMPVPKTETFNGVAGWTPDSSCDTAAEPDECRWYDFAKYYNLQGADVNPDAPPDDLTTPDVNESKLAAYQAKTLYFLPTCEAQETQGITGGPNFGILAEIPVLVR